MIEKIQIKNFTVLDSDLEWELFNDVNILIGDNGLGKSTLLKILKEALKELDEDIDYNVFWFVDEMSIALCDNASILVDAEGRHLSGISSLKNIRVKKIDSFDGEKELTALLKDKIRGDYFKYRSDLATSFAEIVNNKDHQNMTIGEVKSKIFGKLDLFESDINKLFSETEKTFFVSDFVFHKKGSTEPIPPENLSSGEKQVFYLLLTCLLQKEMPCILLLDEPEISLHIEWQKNLIKMMRELNPSCQIIAVTHSPSMFLYGWQNRKKSISDLMVEGDNEDEDDKTETKGKPIAENPSGNGKDNTKKTPSAKTEGKAAKMDEKTRSETSRFFEPQPKSIVDLNKRFGYRTTLDLATAKAILDTAKERGLKPDIYTYTTLIAKIETKKEAVEIFKMLQEQKKLQPDLQPTLTTLNVLLKKARNVEDGLNDLQYLFTTVAPDIITFSTLLGKARTVEEVEKIEEMRKYFNVQINEKYKEKLHFKR